MGLLNKLKSSISKKHSFRNVQYFLQDNFWICLMIIVINMKWKQRKKFNYPLRIINGLSVVAYKESLYFKICLIDETQLRLLPCIRFATIMFQFIYLKWSQTQKAWYSANITRNSDKYTIPKYRIQLYEKSFLLDTIKLWNLLLSWNRKRKFGKKF